MFDSLWSDLRYQLRTGGFRMWVIVISVFVFVALQISASYHQFSAEKSTEIYHPLLKWLSLSSSWYDDLIHPWVWLTHLFTHQSFFHLLWNMLSLYWFGMIVEDLIGQRHAIRIFVLAGLAGALLFMLSCAIFPWMKYDDHIAYGTSASVMGLLFAAAALSPDYQLTLLLIGRVSIKYIALAWLVLDLLFVGQNSNSGGHAAHIGGALAGYLYIVMLRSGISFNRQSKNALRTRRQLSSTRTAAAPLVKKTETNAEVRLNEILDKIRKNGMASLTEDEKKFLEQLSEK